MSEGTVSVLIPLDGSTRDSLFDGEPIEEYLRSTGFEADLIPLRAAGAEGFGSMLRRGLVAARGETVVVIDASLPYRLSAIGDAVAMIRSRAADLVFATMRRQESDDPRFVLLRWFLVPILPDPSVRLRAFSAEAARLVVGESKLTGGGCDLEIAFLANKYGFRIERLHVDCDRAALSPTFGALSGLTSAVSVRMNERRMAYRASRRCPVCFSSEVWSCAQIPGNIVRACHRCKCRYLNEFQHGEDEQPVRRVLQGTPLQADSGDETQSARGARERTSLRRLALLRRHLTPRARLLQIGAGDGTFGLVASREFEFVGIEAAPAAARAARAHGLEVYCATISNFVNTGPPFDAIAVFHVFEDVCDPHDALGRIGELLKPGGILLLSAFDTEGLLYLLTERKRMAHNFRTHSILYSRSALIELLERSGFEIDAIGPDLEYRDRKFLRHLLLTRWPSIGRIASAILNVLPNPLLVGSGSIRIVARRRSGLPITLRPVRSIEATHAR